MTRGPWRSARAPMPKPVRPPSTRLTESAVEMAPRLHPKLSARTGRNTPYAASGVAMPKVIMNRAATISQRRAGGRIRRFLSHRRGLRSGTRTRACPRPRVWCITNDGNSKGGENDMAQLRIPLDAQRFAKGLTWKDYMAQMGDTRVRTEDNYAKSGLTDDERKFFGTVTAVRYVLMLAENDAPGGPLWRAAAQEVRLLLDQQLGLAPKK